jgi:hypothetical protein
MRFGMRLEWQRSAVAWAWVAAARRSCHSALTLEAQVG